MLCSPQYLYYKISVVIERENTPEMLETIESKEPTQEELTGGFNNSLVVLDIPVFSYLKKISISKSIFH